MKASNTVPTETCLRLRDQIHQIVDPLWQQGLISRAFVYRRLSEATGVRAYHNSQLNDEKVGEKALNEAIKIYTQVLKRKC